MERYENRIWVSLFLFLLSSVAWLKPEDWQKACQAMAILGMLAGLAALALAAFIFIMGLVDKDYPNMMAMGSVAAAAFSCKSSRGYYDDKEAIMRIIIIWIQKTIIIIIIIINIIIILIIIKK